MGLVFKGSQRRFNRRVGAPKSPSCAALERTSAPKPPPPPPPEKNGEIKTKKKNSVDPEQVVRTQDWSKAWGKKKAWVSLWSPLKKTLLFQDTQTKTPGCPLQTARSAKRETRPSGATRPCFSSAARICRNRPSSPMGQKPRGSK